MEVARQFVLAKKTPRRAEEQKKFLMEKRKQEDELKQVKQQEEHFERVKELWKSKRRDKSHVDDEEDGHSERKKKREKKRRKKDRQSKTYNETNDPEANMVEETEEMEEEDGELRNGKEEDGAENTQDFLVAAGLEDFEDEDATDAPASSISRRRRAWSESDEEEIAELPTQSSPEAAGEEKSARFQESDIDNQHRLGTGRSNGAHEVDEDDDES